jgi:hypothetical protein
MGGFHHGIDDLGVAGAATEVAGEADSDLVEGRLRSKRDRGHDHPGRADAALRPSEFHERPLQRMTAAEPLDSREAHTVRVSERYQA